jgi:branched-chain amino acid transport system ATP-binding protein
LVRREERCAVILIEHDVGFVMRHSDRIIALNMGTVLGVGTPDEVRSNAAVVDAYLGRERTR